MKEYLDIVDENGNPTGKTVDREIAHAEGVPHRTTHLWLLRKKDRAVQILLQKRAEIKSSFQAVMTFPARGISRRAMILFRRRFGNWRKSWASGPLQKI